MSIWQSIHYNSCSFTLCWKIFSQHSMFLPCSQNCVMLFSLSLSFSRFAEHFVWEFMLLKHMGQCQGKKRSQNKFVMIHFNQKRTAIWEFSQHSGSTGVAFLQVYLQKLCSFIKIHIQMQNNLPAQLPQTPSGLIS